MISGGEIVIWKRLCLCENVVVSWRDVSLTQDCLTSESHLVELLLCYPRIYFRDDFAFADASR